LCSIITVIKPAVGRQRDDHGSVFVKEKEYAARRNEILDVAQRLFLFPKVRSGFYSGYLERAPDFKGALPLLPSKLALLEALIERMQQEVFLILTPMAEDLGLSALEKIQRFLDTAGRWKTERKDFILSLLRVWYADENAIFRYKVQASLMKKTGPLFARIIRQGVEEGTLTTPYPDKVGDIILPCAKPGNDFVELLFASKPEGIICRARSMVAAYTDALCGCWGPRQELLAAHRRRNFEGMGRFTG
jgi:AcrR family transcriptional regulator